MEGLGFQTPCIHSFIHAFIVKGKGIRKDDDNGDHANDDNNDEGEGRREN